MLLYENNGTKVDVYTLEPNCKEDLTKYRKQEIEKLDHDDLFYCFETNNGTIMKRFLDADELDVRFLAHEECNASEDWWSEIKKQKPVTRSEKFVQQEILEDYIDGYFSHVLPTRTFISSGGADCYLDNYLATGESTMIDSRFEKNTIYRIENMIKLPNNLCALQLLLHGEFSRILASGLDYVQALNYFKAVKETEIDLDQLKSVVRTGLVSETYVQIERKIDTTAKILQNVKKMG